MSEHKTLVCLLVLGVSACRPVREVSEDASVPGIRFIVGSDREPDAGPIGEIRSAASALEGLHRVPLPEWMDSYGDMWLYQFEGTTSCSSLDVDWMDNKNCGPTSVAVVFRYLLNKRISPICVPIPEASVRGFRDVHAMVRWQYCDGGDPGVSGGYECTDHAHPWGASESQMVTVMASEGISSDVRTCDHLPAVCPDISDPYAIIVDNVDHGRLTIAHVSSCEYRGTPCVKSHWIPVYGYDSDGVYIQEPAYQSPPTWGPSDPGHICSDPSRPCWGSERRITREQFVNAVNRVGGSGAYMERILITVNNTLYGIRHHPPGALVKRAGHPEIYLVDVANRLRWLTTEDALRSRRLYRDPGDPFGLVVTISEDEFACYGTGPVFDWPVTMRVTSCDAGNYYLTIDDRGDQRKWRVTGHPGEAAFRALIASWGFRESEVLSGYGGCGFPTQATPLYIRDGTVVHETGSALDGYVTYAGVLFDIRPELVAELGYDAADVVELPIGGATLLTRGRDATHPAITHADTDVCSAISCSLPTVSGAYPGGIGGGGGGDVDCDADHDGYTSPTCGGSDCDDGHADTNPDALEVCDGRDNNCTGGVDETFDLQWDDRNCGVCNNACTGSAHCVSGTCLAGGCSTDAQCDDGADCTGDSCQDHVCHHYPRTELCPSGQYCHQTAGCMPYGYCTSNDQCAYDAACTVDRCVGTSCVHTPDDSRCNVFEYCDPLEGNCRLRNTDGDSTVDIDDCAPLDPARHPGAVELCNGLDDDCDGLIDEGGVCAPAPMDAGMPVLPDAGHDAGHDAGVDAGVDAGRDAGVDAGHDAGTDAGPPPPTCIPSTETCNGRDDDCDGVVDNGNPGGGASCGFSIGLCRPGTVSCAGGMLVCVGGVRAVPEICDGLDNDCDGLMDTGLIRSCVTSCGAGVESCTAGVWGRCSARLPTVETCNGIDDDCDGLIDEDGVCTSRGHFVQVRFCPGVDAVFSTNLPNLGARRPYAYPASEPCRFIEFRDVLPNRYLMQGLYLNASGSYDREVEGVPDGSSCWLRRGVYPEAWVDGVRMPVTYGRDLEGTIACAFFLDIR